ncbi:MAG: hypothetical protein AAB035_00330 [Nitrospirota bacterium]
MRFVKFSIRSGRSALFLMAGIITFFVPANLFAITFQFDRTVPGVKEFVESYIQFSVQGTPIASVLPPVFYMVTPRSEREALVVAKVKNLQKDKAINALLAGLVGGVPQQMKGPKGKTVFYHPAPQNAKLSAYLKWDNWLFLSGNPDALIHLLKTVKTPDEWVTPNKAFLSDGLLKNAGVRFWADNTKGDLTALMRENQQRSIIPMIKEPDQIKRLSGVFRLGPQKKIAAQATAIPVNLQYRAPLKKELETSLETSRRLLELFKVPSSGSVKEKGNTLAIQLSIDDYHFGQPGLFKRAQAPASPKML